MEEFYDDIEDYWYTLYCQTTLSEQKRQELFSRGVVSNVGKTVEEEEMDRRIETGEDKEVYNAYISYNSNGKIVAVKIIFI